MPGATERKRFGFLTEIGYRSARSLTECRWPRVGQWRPLAAVSSIVVLVTAP